MVEAAEKILSPLWDADEQSAWRPPERITPSQWAERYRILTRGDSDITGPYRNDNAPYLRGMMDLACADGVTQINIMKCAQAGVSEAMRNLIGYWAHLDPDPVGLGLPDRSKGRKIVKNRYLPLFYQTPVLRELFVSPAREGQLEQIRLVNGFLLHLMWSGSATSTASDPMRRVINDEVDKMASWAGDEPSPVGRTWKRLRTYGDRKCQVNISTPTTSSGEIFRLFGGSTVKLYFYVPCPHCGHWQRLVFPQLKGWDRFKTLGKIERAAMVRQEKAVWYECIACGRHIRDEEKSPMIRRGRWTTEGGYVVDYHGKRHADAESVERWPDGTSIGMQLSALYCLWESWIEIVCEFIRAEGDIAATYNFKTETLGEPFEFQVSRATPGIFEAKSKDSTLPPGIVPAWAWMVIMTIDTQQDHFYFVIRAWGAGMKSQRIAHGRAMTFDDLDRLAFKTPLPVEGGKFSPMLPATVLIDSGGTHDEQEESSRTMQVYQWVIPRQSVVHAIKGASRPGPGLFWPMRDPIGTSGDPAYTRRRAPLSLRRAWLVDTHQANDLLAKMIVQGTESEDQAAGETWLLNSQNDEEYNRHMAALHKTACRHGTRVVETWQPVQSGARHDYRDCEAYQIVGAYMSNVHILQDEQTLTELRLQMEEQAANAKKSNVNNDNERSHDRWQPRPIN